MKSPGNKVPEDELLERLASDDWSIRRDTLKETGKQGPGAGHLIAYITPLLEDPHWKVRAWAARALGYIGKTFPGLVEQITTMLEDEYKTVRTDACLALGMIGQEPELAAPKIVSAWQDHRIDADSAMEALGGFGETSSAYLPLFLQALSSSEFTTQYVAARNLHRIGVNLPLKLVPSGVEPEIQAPLERPPMLPSSDLESRVAARRARAVASLAFHSPEILAPRLPDLLVDKSKVVRRAAREAVPELGEVVTPYLVTALSDLLQARKLEAVADALATLGPRAGQAVAALQLLLAHPNGSVSRVAASALGQIGAASRRAIPDLVANWSDSRVSVRRCIVGALARLGSLPSQHFGQLEQMLRDEDEWVRASALELAADSGYELPL